MGRGPLLTHPASRHGRIAAIALVVMIGAVSLPVRAATLLVDTQADDLAEGTNGSCSLREAVLAANRDEAVDGCAAGSGADEIALGAGRYLLAIPGADEDQGRTGDLDLRSDVSIRGAGIGVTFIDGAGLDGVVDVHGAVAVELKALEIVKGERPGEQGRSCGGGIRNREGRLSLVRVALRQNVALARGSGGEVVTSSGGGLCNESKAEARLRGSFVQENRAAGGRVGSGPARGGGIFSAGRLDLRDSLVASNLASTGMDELQLPVPGEGGGLYVAAGEARVQQSTIARNEAGFGGGILSLARLLLDASTLSHNQGWHAFAPSEGGMLWTGSGGGLRVEAGRAGLAWTTVADNTARSQATGGIDGLEVLEGASLVVGYSLLGDSCGGGGSIESKGRNVAADESCGLDHATDRVGLRLAMGPLREGENGVPVRRPRPGNPALDPPPLEETNGARAGAVQVRCDGADADGDGLADECDLCEEVAAEAHVDADGDGYGDVCDLCPKIWNPGQDATDSDGDGVPDECDSCRFIWQTNQVDTDGDGLGDACDNCPAVTNLDQVDLDADGIGRVCDVCIDRDGDGFGDPASASCAHPQLDESDSTRAVGGLDLALTDGEATTPEAADRSGCRSSVTKSVQASPMALLFASMLGLMARASRSKGQRDARRGCWLQRVLLGACALVLVAGATVSVLVGNWLSSPAPASVVAPPNAGPFEDVAFASDSGFELRGWFVPGEAGRGAVVLLHGIRANRTSLVSRAIFLHELGHAVLLFDLQAHGESGGDAITFGARESLDAESAVAWLRARLPGERIAALGVSLGGAACLLGSKPLEVDALVLESVFPDIHRATRNRIAERLGEPAAWLTPVLLSQMRLRLGVHPDDLRPVERIADLQVPVFVLSGAADVRTTEAETRELFEAASEPRQLWMVPGAGHVNLHRHAGLEYERRIAAFLERSLVN